MNALRFFRFAAGLLSLLWAGSAAAQMHDVERATPRVPISLAEPAAPGGSEAPAAEPAARQPELTTIRPLQLYPVRERRRLIFPGAREVATERAGLLSPTE